MTATGIKPVSVLYVVMDRMARTESCIEKILSFSNTVPSEIVDLLTAIETYSHFTSVRQIVHLTEQLSGGTAGVGNKDLTIWSRQIFDYLLLVDRLDAYSRQFGLAQPPQRPPGLIGGSDRESNEIPLLRLMNGNSEGWTSSNGAVGSDVAPAERLTRRPLGFLRRRLQVQGASRTR